MRAFFGLFLGAFFLGNTGCVERILQVRSDPSEASVYVNGKAAGTTPLDHSFDYYGTFEVALRAEGCFSHRVLKYAGPPWYQMFPLDLFSELLVPWTIRDTHAVEVRLIPLPEEVQEGKVSRNQQQDLKKKAEALREILAPKEDAQESDSGTE